MKERSLAERALHGIGWTTADKWVRSVISLVVFVLLARLLDPVAFGLVALANVYLAFCSLFAEQGFSAALIQREELGREHLDTAFWTSIGIGIVLVLATWLLASPVSTLFGEPRLRPIVIALSANLVISALSSVQIAILKREFRFRSLAKRNVLATGAGGAVGIGMAWSGFGVWSLVGMSLATSIVALIVLWSAAVWRPGLSFSTVHYHELFRFGSSVVGTNIVKFIGKNVDRLLIGLFLSTEAVGIYKIAHNLVHQLSSAMSSIFSVVALPVFSRIQTDHARLVDVFSRFTRISLITAAPLFAILLVHAGFLVPLLFGAQWLESIPLLRVLALLGLLRAVTYFNEPMLYALGKPGSYLTLNVGMTIGRVVLILAAVPFGLTAVAAAVVAAAYLQWPWAIAVISRHSGLSVGRFGRSLFHSLIPTLCMVALLLAIERSGAAVENVLSLLLAVGVAATLNAGVLWVTDRAFLVTVFRMLRRHGSLRPA